MAIEFAGLYVFSNLWTSKLGNLVAANMVPPDSAEVASTSFTPTASTYEWAALAGRGEGLNCSILSLVDKRAFPHSAETEPVSSVYRQACVSHDYCYRHGAATYGYAQSDCDAMLAKATLRICGLSEQSTSGDECLGRARKVYAGLVAGGAASFRPLVPDLRTPSGYGPAYAKWPETLLARFDPSGLGDAATKRVEADLKLALKGPGFYEGLSDDGVQRLLDAWFDRVSLPGEYDPYPLGTASVTIPRLIHLDAPGQSLVWYRQRPSGTQLNLYLWSNPGPDGIQHAIATASCRDEPARCDLLPAPGELESPPWALLTAPSSEHLVWWRRLATSADSTGGTVANVTRPLVRPAAKLGERLKDAKPTWLLSRAGNIDFGAANLFPVQGAESHAMFVAITRQNRPLPGRELDVTLSAWAGQKQVGRGWAAVHSASRLDLLQFRPYLATPPSAVAVQGAIEVTLFMRGHPPSSYRDRLEARTWRIPVPSTSVRNAPEQTPVLLRPRNDAQFHLPESAEPFASLWGPDNNLGLLSISCPEVTKLSFADRIKNTVGVLDLPPCDSKSHETVIRLFHPLPGAADRVSVAGRYLSRPIIVRDDRFTAASSSRYSVVLVRYGIRRVAGKSVLNAFIRVAPVDGTVAAGREFPVGVISPLREGKVAEALARASRLFPLIGDTNGDCVPDLVLADTDKGTDTISVLGSVDAGGLRFGGVASSKRGCIMSGEG